MYTSEQITALNACSLMGNKTFPDQSGRPGLVDSLQHARARSHQQAAI